VKAVVRAVVLEIIVVRKFVWDVYPAQQARLVRPAPRDVAHCIAASSEYESRDAEGLDVRHTITVTFETKVEAAEPVSRERVGAALKHYGARSEPLHDAADHLNRKTTNTRENARTNTCVFGGGRVGGWVVVVVVGVQGRS
jgi:hypothetical protein